MEDYKEMINERIQEDPEFARELLKEAAALFLNGEAEIARLMFRNLVNATVGFEGLAGEIGISGKSLHRMLSVRGNPTMENLALILKALRKSLSVELDVKVEAVV